MMFRRPAVLALTLLIAAAGAASAQQANDPRIGLRAGWWNAGQAAWNMRLVSTTAPTARFTNPATPGALELFNSDMTFTGNNLIQGNFTGWQVWDISNPGHPTLRTAYFCPGSQSDVSVYRNLLFVSGEATSARLDCGTQGVSETVSHDRLRGIRIFDITDITNPRYIGNVQTCRGSHTHTVVIDPRDTANVYIYISGTGQVRAAGELAGCSELAPDQDPNSALFRIEVIQVPLANPASAHIVSSARIFQGLRAAAAHGDASVEANARQAMIDTARMRGAYVIRVNGRDEIVPPLTASMTLDSLVRARGASSATPADSNTLRNLLVDVYARRAATAEAARTGPNQCHDITVYPAIGWAGGACGGYGLLLDIRDPAHPRRVAAAADSNFSYWHSATFNNDGTKVLFSDEWGGGLAARCRATDKPEWGADAIFDLRDSTMTFRSYYKLPVPQLAVENCVAHNGSLIPIPGRDIMAQGWYQGGVSVFEWTDAAHPREIAFFDRGPMDSTKMQWAGSWSAYWYNGLLYSSEMARGLDIFELQPSSFITQNELDAARTIHFDYLNTQGQPHLVWPPSFALARAYVDQLERSNGLTPARINAVRGALDAAEGARTRRAALSRLGASLRADAARSSDAAKVRLLATAVRDLGNASR